MLPGLSATQALTLISGQVVALTTWEIAKIVGGLILAIIAVAIVGFFIAFGKLWIQAYSSGCPVPIAQFVGMFLRKVSPQVIVNVLVTSHKAGIPIPIDKLESHVLARGNVMNVMQALVAASRANMQLTFERAAAIDLAGRDILAAVKLSINPQVIDCPDPSRGRPTIDAVAKEGIQLKCKARVTVRTNLDRLVGGATEETIVARVGEGIVAAIGQSTTHKDVLANPRAISREVLDAGLDAGTAFEIVSIDIADIDVGENIGAKLMADQAEAQKRKAQAEAEAQRARAVARGQEMEALGKENRAKVILAEAEVPLAMAEAFRSGRLGIMDYYNFQNIQADTKMRSSLSKSVEEDDSRDSQPQ